MTDNPLSETGSLVRAHFPYFQDVESGRESYLDSAASALKLGACIERISTYLTSEHANIHRGAYELSLQATENYEKAREAVKRFCRVPNDYDVVFTSGATDSVNMLAYGMDGGLVPTGSVILTTLLEHHSNFVPWQQLAKRVGGEFLAAKITKEAELDASDFLLLLSSRRPRVAAFTAHSNAFGTVTPQHLLVEACRKHGCLSVIDATQSVVHGGLDVSEIEADFFVFSAHKLYGPTGLGVLIGRSELLEQLQPVRTGGGMIREVTVEATSWADVPTRFEAGTPPIAEAIAFGATLQALESLQETYDLQGAEDALFTYALSQLSSVKGVEIVGPKEEGRQRSILSFTVDGVHPHDVATIADSHGVQVRGGHHCVMPAMRTLEIGATTRASIGIYSIAEDIDRLVEAILHAHKVLGSS